MRNALVQHEREQAGLPHRQARSKNCDNPERLASVILCIGVQIGWLGVSELLAHPSAVGAVLSAVATAPA